MSLQGPTSNIIMQWITYKVDCMLFRSQFFFVGLPEPLGRERFDVAVHTFGEDYPVACPGVLYFAISFQFACVVSHCSSNLCYVLVDVGVRPSELFSVAQNLDLHVVSSEPRNDVSRPVGLLLSLPSDTMGAHKVGRLKLHVELPRRQLTHHTISVLMDSLGNPANAYSISPGVLF